MRKSKFNESQIVGILKEAEAGVAVADLLRKYGVTAVAVNVTDAAAHCPNCPLTRLMPTGHERQQH